MKTKTIFLIGMMTLSSYIFSQDLSKVIVVSPIVGETIDSAEKAKYKIFLYWKKEEFISAQFVQQSNGQIFLIAKMKDGKIKKIGYSKYEFDDVAFQINSYSHGENGTDENDSLMIITMKDGNQLIGKLIKQDAKQISVLTKSMGTVTLEKNKIENIKKIKREAFKDGKYWFPNPNSTRYFFGPSGFNLSPGEGYYQNTYLFLNSINVGVTKNISLGGGFEFLSVFSSFAGGPIYYFTPKIGFKVADKIHIGGGLLYASIPSGFSGANESEDVGIGYGIFTYGTLENNLTAGGGYGFTNSDWNNRPTISISGMTRVGRRISLITENWFYPLKQTQTIGGYYPNYTQVVSYQYQYIISYGLRFNGESMSVDLGLVNNKDIIKIIPVGIPYIDFVVKFGGKK